MYRLLNEVSVSISGHITCSLQLLQTAISQCKRCRASLCAWTSKRKGWTRWKPAESRQSPGKPSLRRHSPGLYRHQTPAELRQRPGLTGDNRGSTGKVFKCLIPPGWTRSYREGPATTSVASGTTGTVPGTTGIKHLNTFPVESRLSPVKPGRCRSSAGVWCRYSPGECRRSDGIRGFCRDYRLSPGSTFSFSCAQWSTASFALGNGSLQ